MLLHNIEIRNMWETKCLRPFWKIFSNNYITTFNEIQNDAGRICSALLWNQGRGYVIGTHRFIISWGYGYRSPALRSRVLAGLRTIKTLENPSHISFFVVRVFTVGIGDGVSTSLVRNVAKAGGGEVEFVTGTDKLQEKACSSWQWQT